MNEREALKLAHEVFDVQTDSRGRTTFSGDSYAIERFAALVASAEPEREPCCYGGIAHDCHAGEGCRIVKRMKTTHKQVNRS